MKFLLFLSPFIAIGIVYYIKTSMQEKHKPYVLASLWLGVAYVVRGELTVKFDENTELDDLDGEKTVTKEQVFGPGSAFLGVANTWHKSSSTGDEDLIFQVTWLGEKGQPVKVSSN